MSGYISRVLSIANVKGINKPNEDFSLCDDERGFYALVDGVSRDKIGGIYPNPSPSADVSKIFVDSIYEYYKNHDLEVHDINNLLLDMVRYGNEQIQHYNQKKKWENDFLPGTVGIVGIIKYNTLFYAYIGDCYGIIVNQQKELFTRCQTKEIAKHKGEFDSKTIRNYICNNKKHPFSYGVLNGDPSALDFLECGYRKLCEGEKILLSTDGFYDAISQIPAVKLCNMSLDQIKEYSTDSDDKTLIIIEEDKNA